MSPHHRHGSLLALPPQMLLGLMLLLLLNAGLGVRAMEDNKGEVRRQDFNTNFGGPPLGDNGFVGENPLPRPQGVVDLGNFGDNLAPSDLFQQVDQTFNIANQLTHESGTFQPTDPRTELSNDISSFSNSNGVNENSFADTDSVTENTAFKVFHGPETAGSDNFSSPEDVLTVNFEDNREAFPHPSVRGNHRPEHLGRPNRRPLRPLRRPIRQPFNQRHRNKPRRDRPTPSLLSLLAG